MTNRSLSSKAKQLASIAAAGASAIALTSGKAQAAIITSKILNLTIGFSHTYNPSPGRQTYHPARSTVWPADRLLLFEP